MTWLNIALWGAIALNLFSMVINTRGLRRMLKVRRDMEVLMRTCTEQHGNLLEANMRLKRVGKAMTLGKPPLPEDIAYFKG